LDTKTTLYRHHGTYINDLTTGVLTDARCLTKQNKHSPELRLHNQTKQKKRKEGQGKNKLYQKQHNMTNRLLSLDKPTGRKKKIFKKIKPQSRKMKKSYYTP